MNTKGIAAQLAKYKVVWWWLGISAPVLKNGKQSLQNADASTKSEFASAGVTRSQKQGNAGKCTDQILLTLRSQFAAHTSSMRSRNPDI
jgi:hypothetical protein